jgi:nucleoside-diphosphate-sugar epimerase
MKVFVTGGAGYIGSKLVKKLLENKFKVKVFDSLVFGGESLIPFFDDANFEFVHGDITNSQELSQNIRDCDAVIHLAALVFTGGQKLRDTTLEINYEATRRFIDICKKRGLNKFIFTSTCSNYGETSELATEESPLMSTSAYSESKIKAEAYILQSAGTTFKPTILRLSTVFGLSPRMRFDLIVNELVLEATQKGKVTVYNPKAWRPGLHVDDATEAMKLALLHSVEGVFNVGHSSLNYQKIQLCNIIKKYIPSLQVEEVQSTADPRNYRVSFDKIRKNLGFKPKKTIEDGVVEIMKAVQQGIFKAPNDVVYRNLETYQLKYHDARIKEMSKHVR